MCGRKASPRFAAVNDSSSISRSWQQDFVLHRNLVCNAKVVCNAKHGLLRRSALACRGRLRVTPEWHVGSCPRSRHRQLDRPCRLSAETGSEASLFDHLVVTGEHLSRDGSFHLEFECVCHTMPDGWNNAQHLFSTSLAPVSRLGAMIR